MRTIHGNKTACIKVLLVISKCGRVPLMNSSSSALLLKAVERWDGASTGELEKALEPYAADVVYQSPDGDFTGREALKEYLSVYFNAISENQDTAEDIPAEGDKVVTRVTATGTHTGELQGIPSSGKPINVSGISVMRVADGKIAEEWEIFDIMGIMQQIGAIPSP